MRAVSLLRESVAYRSGAFRNGLAAAGYRVMPNIVRPEPGDVLVVWNRYQQFDGEARRFERAGARVVVAENGHLDKRWRHQNDNGWYSLAIGHHAGAGTWRYGGPERWDSWRVTLDPWRHGGLEVVVLGQRGIGEPGIAAPKGWAEDMRRRLPMPSRIRPHPGRNGIAKPLEEDLRDASCVVTWHSAAAARALICGVPVFYESPTWLGKEAGKPVSALIAGEEPNRDDSARLEMFRRMAWAMWRLDEIESGVAFRHLLQ